MDLKALADLKVADVVEKLDALSVEQLQELRAIEVADSNRVTLVERIDAKLADAAEQAAAPAAEPTPPAAPPAYLADDYTGPLTIDQAQARLAAKAKREEAAG